MFDNKNTDSVASELIEANRTQGVIDQSSNLAQRARQLVQTLRNLQTQQMSAHCQQQIQNFVQEQHKTLEEKAAEADAEGCLECKRNALLPNPSDAKVPSTSQKDFNARSSAVTDSTQEHHLPSNL